MQVLLIEDDDHKRQRIKTFLEATYTNMKIVEVMSYNSACRAISESSWDLLLVDMSIPTFDKSSSETGGRPRSLGGKEIIRRITRKKIAVPFIIVTQFSTFSDDGRSISAAQIDQEIKDLKNENYLGMTLFNTTKSDWKAQLETKIDSLAND